jgi:uncharacterized protein
MYAVDSYYSDTGRVADLIAAGADVNAKDNSGSTPLIHAVRYSRKRIIVQLLAAGADARARDNEAKTARDYATQNHGDDVIALLIEAEQRWPPPPPR